jgi:hypothetical protein
MAGAASVDAARLISLEAELLELRRRVDALTQQATSVGT